MARIAVGDTLSDVKQALIDKGFDVIPLRSQEDARGCDCCVVSGMDENIMGIQNILTEADVIDSRGMSAKEVCEKVEDHIH